MSAFRFCVCGHERDEHDNGGCFQPNESGDAPCPCRRFAPDPDTTP